MRKQKLATAACIILSVAFVMALGYLIHFKMFVPFTNNIYELDMYYPEELYKEYQKELERMIADKDYISEYHTKASFYSEDNQGTLIIEIGDYNNRATYANYVTATVENFGTQNQKVTYERSRESAEEAQKDAQSYKRMTNIFAAVFAIILIAFGAYLVKKSIKREYSKVLWPIGYIVILIVVCGAIIKFLTS